MTIAAQPIGGKSIKYLGAVETRDMLKLVTSRSFDPEAFASVELNKREVSIFAAEVLRPLRSASIAAALPRLTYLIEATYYEAYAKAYPIVGHQRSRQLDQFEVT